jgi:hypothetical protein
MHNLQACSGHQGDRQVIWNWLGTVLNTTCYL